MASKVEKLLGRAHSGASLNVEMKARAKTVDYYKALPYRRVFIAEKNAGFSAEVAELPGCLSQGETIEEAAANLEDALALWLEVAIEQRAEIPEPFESRKYSGRFNVRTPASLHRALVERAREEGVSLNAYVNASLERAVAEDSGRSERQRGQAENGPKVH